MASTDTTISERISRRTSEDDTGIQESNGESAKERRLKKYEKVKSGNTGKLIGASVFV